MHRAFGYSLSLHFAFAASLLALRISLPAPPPVLSVAWIETFSDQVNGRRNASSNQGVLPKLKARAIEPVPMAKAGLAQKATGESASATSALTPEVQMRRANLEQSYLAQVQRTLESLKVYPPLARRLGQTGRVGVRFVLGKSGDVKDSKLVDPSPFPVLNEAAESLLVSAHFPPIPQELHRSLWEITYNIGYELD